jgi:phosphoribosylglycinamide formyltransferase-1
MMGLYNRLAGRLLEPVKKLKLGVLISGRGSNLQALIDACGNIDYPASIAIVISNEPGVLGLDRARKAGLPALTMPHREFPTKAAFESAVDAALQDAGVDLVCLAGFMRLLTADFVNRWQGRIINIHPSLLPKYRGLDTHARALAAGDPETGCTVHYVVPEMDEGPVILQSAIPILPGDTVEMLAERLLPVEHRTYVDAVRMVADRLAC